MSVYNLKKPITKEELSNFDSVEMLTKLQISIIEDNPEFWKFEQFIPMNNRKCFVIYYNFQRDQEKPNDVLINACKTAGYIKTSSPYTQFREIYVGVWVEIGTEEISLDSAVSRINHAIMNDTGAISEVGFVKGISRNFYMPKNMRAYPTSAPQRKRAAPKKRTPAVRVNVRKMF